MSSIGVVLISTYQHGLIFLDDGKPSSKKVTIGSKKGLVWELKWCKDKEIALFNQDAQKYLSSDSKGVLSCNSGAIGNDETWEYQDEGGNQVAFKSAHGQYLCAALLGKLSADRKAMKDWEKFKLWKVESGGLDPKVPFMIGEAMAQLKPVAQESYASLAKSPSLLSEKLGSESSDPISEKEKQDFVAEAWENLKDGQKDPELIFYLAEKANNNSGYMEILFVANDAIKQPPFVFKLVELGYAKSIYFILESLASVNPKLLSKHANALLGVAINAGQLEAIKTFVELLEDDLNLSQPNLDGMAPLELAKKQGNQEIITYFEEVSKKFKGSEASDKKEIVTKKKLTGLLSKMGGSASNLVVKTKNQAVTVILNQLRPFLEERMDEESLQKLSQILYSNKELMKQVKKVISTKSMPLTRYLGKVANYVKESYGERVDAALHNQEVMLRLVKIFAAVVLDKDEKSTKAELISFIESLKMGQDKLSEEARNGWHLDSGDPEILKNAFLERADEMWKLFEKTGQVSKKNLAGKLTKSDLLALHVYSDHDLPVFSDINYALRKWTSKDPEERQKAEEKVINFKIFVLRLSKATIGLPGHKGKLYRGQSYRGDEQIYQKGANVVWPAFTSCSTNEPMALEYSKGGLMFEIDLKEEYGCFVQTYSAFPMEAEVLLSPFTGFKVIDVVTNDQGDKRIFMTCTGLPTFLLPLLVEKKAE